MQPLFSPGKYSFSNGFLCVFVDHSLPKGEGNQMFLTQVLKVIAKSTSIRKKKRTGNVDRGIHENEVTFWPACPACYATFQMRGIFYIWAVNTWPFCHFGREINKMFKNEQCSGSIICHLSLWGIHGTFNFSIFTTNSNAVAWSHQTSNNTGLAGNLLLRPPSPMAEMAAEPEQEEVGPTNAG